MPQAESAPTPILRFPTTRTTTVRNGGLLRDNLDRLIRAELPANVAMLCDHRRPVAAQALWSTPEALLTQALYVSLSKKQRRKFHAELRRLKAKYPDRESVQGAWGWGVEFIYAARGADQET